MPVKLPDSVRVLSLAMVTIIVLGILRVFLLGKGVGYLSVMG